MEEIRGSCWTSAAGVIALVFTAGCQPTAATGEKPAAAAKSTHPVAETSLNTIEVSPEAFKNLRIKTSKVVDQEMQRHRSYGGETMLPNGASVIVSAPLTGTLQLAPKKKEPKVGQAVTVRDPVFELWPLLSPERAVLTPSERIRFAEARNTVAQAQADAQAQVQQAQVQVDAAKIAHERAKRLLSEKAGTQRAVDEAQAQLQLAEKTLEAARTRKALVDAIKLDEKETGSVTAMPILAPLTGQVRALHVRPGEMVPAGAPLFEIMNSQTLWIRVPVYVGELSEVDPDQPIELHAPDGRPQTQPLTAKPTALPPTAVPLASTVDLYYELPNPQAAFRPGQRLTAKVSLKGSKVRRTIPWSAVIHDVYGGQWVYQQTGERKYVRRRVEVEWVKEGVAVLSQGLGTRKSSGKSSLAGNTQDELHPMWEGLPIEKIEIVTAGAMELSGTEFGFSK